MGFSDFWLQFNNGKKEQLNDVGHGVRKEQLDPKFAPLFEFFDRNGDGVLETNELRSIFDNVKNFSGDNVLDSKENATVESIFADQVHMKDADLQGFVKSVSDASKDIVSSEEKVTPDGGKEIKTEYKDGTISTIAYYPNGDFKYEKLVKRYIETKYVIESPDGKETYLTKEEYDKALKDIKYLEGKFNVSENFSVDNAQTTETTYNKELEDTLIKPHSNVPNSARGIASTNISEGSKVSKITNEIEEPIEQVFSSRALAESLGVNLNTEDGKKILERLSHFDRDWLKILKDGTEVKELLTSNDLTPTFDNISNVLEIVYGITLRTEEELEASKPQMEKLINQIRTAEFLKDFYLTVAGWNDLYTDNIGLFGLGAEGIGYLINKLGLDGENHYQWADSCREFAEHASDLKILNPEKFNEGFKKIYGENSDKWGIDFDEQAFKDLFALIDSGKAVNNEGEFTNEYKAAILKAINFVAENPNESTFNQVMNGLGEAVIMIATLGWAAEAKGGQMLASAAISTFSRAGVAIASRQVNNKLLQGALRFAGKTVKLIGPALNEGTKMYTYSLVMGTATNVANRAIKFSSEENSWEKLIDTEAMVLDSAKGSALIGAFAGVFGSTVTQKVMQHASRVSTKVVTALADKFAKGAVDANEVFMTILEKSAPTKIAEVAALAADILGFTAFESIIAIVKNLPNYPEGYSVEDLTKILWEEFKGQGYNLGQIKVVAWLLGSRSARMQASKYMRNPIFEGATLEQVGKGYKINLPDGKSVECKNTTEMITAMHFISRGETALSKIFARPKANAQNEQKANDTNEGVSQGVKSGVNEGENEGVKTQNTETTKPKFGLEEKPTEGKVEGTEPVEKSAEGKAEETTVKQPEEGKVETTELIEKPTKGKTEETTTKKSTEITNRELIPKEANLDTSKRKQKVANYKKELLRYLSEEDYNENLLDEMLNNLTNNRYIDDYYLEKIFQKILYYAKNNDQFDYIEYDTLFNFINHTFDKVLDNPKTFKLYCILLDNFIGNDALSPQNQTNAQVKLFEFSDKKLNNLESDLYIKLWKSWIDIINKDEDLGIDNILKNLYSIETNVDIQYFDEACVLFFLEGKPLIEIITLYNKIATVDKIYDLCKLNLSQEQKMYFRQNLKDVIPILMYRNHSLEEIVDLILINPNLFIKTDISNYTDIGALADIVEELSVIDTSALYKYAEDENDATLLDLSFLEYTKVSQKLERAYRGEGINVLNTYQLEDGTLLGDKIEQAIELIHKYNDYTLFESIKDEIIGSYICHERHMSTSLSKETAIEFAEKYDGFLWEISTFEGAPGICMDLFNSNGEQEYLFCAGLNFIIKDISIDNATNRIILSAQMVPK